MRLINSSSLQLKNFPSDRDLPKYAILSHTWGELEEEVLFEDMTTADAGSKAGYMKLWNACREANKDGLEYLWMDTCCIDKRSSADLSEAINSMYSWYKNASVCYAYLSDFPADVPVIINSRWFTRGWTLQELIAPSNLIFYSSDWQIQGTKLTLQTQLAMRTGISVGILNGQDGLESASVARRMSWAANRETTRTEDEAYCLMGLFDVNMPMLYGEGSKAFLRLQEEVMKQSDDQSLFAWTDPSAVESSYYGLLAKSPKNFKDADNIVPYQDWGLSAPFSISNKGLRLETYLTHIEENLYIAALSCPGLPDNDGFVGIYLRRLINQDCQYVRVYSQTLCQLGERGALETVYVRQSASLLRSHDVYPVHAFQLRRGPSPEDGYTLTEVVASSSHDLGIPENSSSFFDRRWRMNMQSVFKITKSARRLAGALIFERSDGEKIAVLLGSMAEFTVGFDIVRISDTKSLDDFQKIFKPQAPKSSMSLADHEVRIMARSVLYKQNKCYMVDINLESKFSPLNPIHQMKSYYPKGPIYELEPVHQMKSSYPKGPVDELEPVYQMKSSYPEGPIDELEPYHQMESSYPKGPIDELEPIHQMKSSYPKGPIYELEPIPTRGRLPEGAPNPPCRPLSSNELSIYDQMRAVVKKSEEALKQTKNGSQRKKEDMAVTNSKTEPIRFLHRSHSPPIKVAYTT